MKANVYKLDGTKGDSVDLSDEIFNITPNDNAIHQSLLNELANKRLGTACTKTRGDMSGSTKKPWRQKGTGRARSGTVKSPVWTGGGTVFGPKPRDYSYKLPKKIKRLSVRSILSKKNQISRLKVVDNLMFETLKAKDVYNTLMNISCAKEDFKDLKNNKLRKKLRNYRLIVITEDSNKTIRKAGANLPWLRCLAYNRLNTIDLFYAHEIMIEKPVVNKLSEYIAK